MRITYNLPLSNYPVVREKLNSALNFAMKIWRPISDNTSSLLIKLNNVHPAVKISGVLLVTIALAATVLLKRKNPALAQLPNPSKPQPSAVPEPKSAIPQALPISEDTEIGKKSSSDNSLPTPPNSSKTELTAAPEKSIRTPTLPAPEDTAIRKMAISDIPSSATILRKRSESFFRETPTGRVFLDCNKEQLSSITLYKGNCDIFVTNKGFRVSTNGGLIHEEYVIAEIEIKNNFTKNPYLTIVDGNVALIYKSTP